MSRARLAPLLGAAALAIAASQWAAPQAGASADTTPAALPTTLETSAGTWASVPMGHLGQRLNTFWQLFFLPKGQGRWTNKVSELGVATNGGLALASPGGSSLVVAAGPSNLLAFSPIVRTAGPGARWSTVVPVPGDAVGLSAAGREVLALVKERQGGRILVAPSSSSAGSWRTLVSDAMLARSPAGRACRPRALSAVGHAGDGAPIVGAVCGRAGTVGLFTMRAGSWHRATVALPPGEQTAVVSVLAIASEGEGTIGLLELRGGSRTQLVTVWSSPGTGHWRSSRPLEVKGPGDVVSAGTAGGEHEYALLRDGASSRLRLVVAEGVGRAWHVLPAPPAGTATVAFGPAGTVQALAVHVSVLTAWRLQHGAARWAKAQVAHVDILFGSSQ